MKTVAWCLFVVLCGLFLFHSVTGTVYSSSQSPFLSVSPTNAPVGSNITITGQGFPPNTSLILYWSTANVSWNVGGAPVPEVLGITTVPEQDVLAYALTNGTGSFFQTVSVPIDNNGQHIIRAVSATDNTTISEATFTVEPSFYFSPSSGPVGTKVTVYASGLGAHPYAVAYHVLFDNQYLGYMTGITTHGQANFTFYVTGTVGPHTISVYNGYPGPAYLNSNQAPSSVSITSYDPPLIPFHGQFNITAPNSTDQVSASPYFISPSFFGITSLAFVIIAFAFVARSENPARMKFGALLIIVALLLGGTALLFVYEPSSNAALSQQQSFTPQATVVRPQIILPNITATSGPRISVSPNVATVGTIVNVTGFDFPPNTVTPLSWSTHVGSHVVGFESAMEPLRNVTTNSAGSFSFLMNVPYDLGGLHNITAPNVAPNGNATLYIERSAYISASQGEEGSLVTITMTGLGWTYQDNIAAVDYDNSFMGYVCGFNTNGNITLHLPVTGAPGYHTIDLYPANYLGPTPPDDPSIAIYRYPILTPYDGPAAVPVFHFSFLITNDSQSSTQSQAMLGNSIGSILLSGASIAGAGAFIVVQAWPRKSRNPIKMADSDAKDTSSISDRA
ncbi:MAG: hypothetical protein JRN20_04570 [Nitrososphaerota archaeon]|nr:hypothetical protein [Nitrososphaerota archaeon]